MDIRKLHKTNRETKREEPEEIASLEFMTDSLSTWDDYDELNEEKHNDA